MIALALLSLVFPLPAVFLLLFAFDVRRSPVVASLVVGLSLACAVYGLQLSSASDIYRHMALLQSYAEVDFAHCFDAGHYSMLYAWDIWCWLISRLGDPYLLQCSAAFVGYSLVAYTVFDYSARIDASRAVAATALLFGICSIPFAEVFIGIRSTIALIMCAVAAYRRFVCSGSVVETVAACVVASMIHQVALLAVVLIALARPLARSPRAGVAICFLAAFFAAGIGSFVLSSVSGSSNPALGYFSNALSSFLSYSEGNEWTRTHSSSLNTRMNVLFTFLWIGVLYAHVLLRRRAEGRGSDVPAASLPVTDALTLAAGAVMVGLSLILDVNGTRLVAFMFPLGLVSFVGRSKALPSSRSKAAFITDALSWLVAAGLFALHAYSLYYGCQDLQAFVTTIAFGAAGAILGGA